MQSFIAFVALAVLAGVQQASAVCASGQMAIGNSIGTNDVLYYNGFLMANNCGIIAQNGETEDPNQMCKGGYDNNVAVYCNGADNPSVIRDTQGHWWNCQRTGDTSCNKYLGYGSYDVTHCCSRQ